MTKKELETENERLRRENQELQENIRKVIEKIGEDRKVDYKRPPWPNYPYHPYRVYPHTVPYPGYIGDWPPYGDHITC